MFLVVWTGETFTNYSFNTSFVNQSRIPGSFGLEPKCQNSAQFRSPIPTPVTKFSLKKSRNQSWNQKLDITSFRIRIRIKNPTFLVSESDTESKCSACRNLLDNKPFFLKKSPFHTQKAPFQVKIYWN